MKIPERNAPCWCGSGRKYKRCHLGFDERLEALHRQGFPIPPQACIKTPAQIEGIRKSASVNTAVLDYVAAHIAPGVSTAEIDGWVQEETRRLGGTPAPLNYESFSKSCCISADDVTAREAFNALPEEYKNFCSKRYTLAYAEADYVKLAIAAIDADNLTLGDKAKVELARRNTIIKK